MDQQVMDQQAIIEALPCGLLRSGFTQILIQTLILGLQGFTRALGFLLILSHVHSDKPDSICCLWPSQRGQSSSSPSVWSDNNWIILHVAESCLHLHISHSACQDDDPHNPSSCPQAEEASSSIAQRQLVRQTAREQRVDALTFVWMAVAEMSHDC